MRFIGLWTVRGLQEKLEDGGGRCQRQSSFNVADLAAVTRIIQPDFQAAASNKFVRTELEIKVGEVRLRRMVERYNRCHRAGRTSLSAVKR
ncbi:MAG: hypothetical protein Fues2KO_45850 [Fuerstiella sp.]